MRFKLFGLGSKQMGRRLIVVHPGSRTSDYSPVQCISFDIFAKPDDIPEHVKDLLYDVGYDVGKSCEYASKYIAQGLPYFISTDTCYSYNLAVKVIKAVFELVRSGFEVVYEGDGKA